MKIGRPETLVRHVMLVAGVLVAALGAGMAAGAPAGAVAGPGPGSGAEAGAVPGPGAPAVGRGADADREVAAATGRHRTITWGPCAEDPTVECGTLAVPIDWRRPDGPTVDLALARRPATDPAARIGSLVINPGGPGGSGVDAVLGGHGFSPSVASRFDLVGFDPRGVGRSHPILCSTALLNGGPAALPANQADFDARIAYNRTLAADCRQRTGPLFDHVDTLSGVRDLDAIRAALGDQKLTYYGISYGTLIGEEYAEVYGDRIRAVVIDSDMDHSLGTAGFLRTETATAQDSFDEFAAWCDRTPACGIRVPGVRAVYAGLKARAAGGGLVLHLRTPDGQ